MSPCFASIEKLPSTDVEAPIFFPFTNTEAPETAWLLETPTILPLIPFWAKSKLLDDNVTTTKRRK